MIHKITSVSNQKFKNWKQLQTAKNRKKQNRFLVESYKLLAEFLSEKSDSLIELVICDKELEFEEKLTTFCSRFSTFSCKDILKNIKIYSLPENLFSKITELENSDGIFGVADRNCLIKGQYCIDSLPDQILVLDGIQDPGNFGAMMRSAEAFGFKTIFHNCSVDPLNLKVMRASMGSIFRIKLIQADLIDLSHRLRENQYQLIGADLNGVGIQQAKIHAPFALYIGNEGHGFTKEISELFHIKLTIPMKGKVESLNAAVSASILMAYLSFQQ